MPNGGSDCCGTCWFNRANHGQRGSAHHDRNVPSFCEIRNLQITNPFYTYCANHPYRRPNRDPIPIGPVVAGEPRRLLEPSPDSEEIRLHLLEILANADSQEEEWYPLGAPAMHVVVDQLVAFREQRAVPLLDAIATWYENEVDDIPTDGLRDAIAVILDEIEE